MLFTTLFTASLILAPALGALTIDTIQLTQCKDATLTWTPDANSKGPYNLIVVDPKAPCSSNLMDLGDHDGNSAPWNVNLPSGTQMQLSLQDANGDEAWSGPVQIAPGDSSCLSATPQPNGASANPTSSPAAASSPSAATGSTGSTSTPAPVQAAGAAANNLGKKTSGGAASYVNASIMVLSAVGTAFTLIL